MLNCPPFVRWCVALNNEWGLYYVMQGYGQKVGPNTRREEIEGYSDEQHRKALELYEETKPKTITIVGYPARRQALYNWINRKRILPEKGSTFRDYNTESHPRQPSLK